MLFGFDFAVEYRLRRLNAAEDALSRHDSNAGADDAMLHALSVPSFCLHDAICTSSVIDEETGRLLQ
jgi:hypothetical protein